MKVINFGDTTRIAFVVEGAPVAQGRPRASAHGGKVRLRDTEESKAYKRMVGTVAMVAMNRQGLKPFAAHIPLVAELLFLFPRAKSTKLEYMTKKPDLDNLEKAILDALNKVAYDDDSDIVRVIKDKDFVRPGEAPGVDVLIRQLRPGEIRARGNNYEI